MIPFVRLPRLVALIALLLGSPLLAADTA